jgi:limonene-1,2-epoxide hydrolase
MPTASETVTAFLALWDRPGGMAQAVRDYFTPDTVYENIGMSRTRGVDEAIDFLSSFGSDASQLAMRADTLTMAEAGDKVLTERIDHILGTDGEPAASFAVMGIFEVAGGKIVAWRDYFDTAAFGGQGQAADSR